MVKHTIFKNYSARKEKNHLQMDMAFVFLCFGGGA